MGLSRRRDSNLIWPGFVDAVTTLLLVLMFVVTIFVVMQSVLQETITNQGDELTQLNGQVAQLADALGLEKTKVSSLEGQVGGLTSTLQSRDADLAAAMARIAAFQTQVAGLEGERDLLTTSLATARSEIDTAAEEARLAAARREALEALIAEAKTKSEADAASLSAALAKIDAAEAARLVDAAALDALRAKLAGSDTELAAMTLALEEQRKKAEETLLLLAAAQTDAAKAVTADEKHQAALAAAQKALTDEQQKSLDSAQKMALLNEQLVELRSQLAGLQVVLTEAKDKDAADKVQLDALGSQLNSALAQVASEQRQRAALEEAERKRLQDENENLARFRSEFFGQLSQVLSGREGVRVVGDRFVFSSEVLFSAGAADLSPEGQAQIANVVSILNEIRTDIPAGIDWIIRVDGHTDNVPLSGTGAYGDNWELSQARALSVVRFMQGQLGFPPDRLAATGFGQYRPVAEGNSEAARSQNRRIELKLTER